MLIGHGDPDLPDGEGFAGVLVQDILDGADGGCRPGSPFARRPGGVGEGLADYAAVDAVVAGDLPDGHAAGGGIWRWLAGVRAKASAVRVLAGALFHGRATKAGHSLCRVYETHTAPPGDLGAVFRLHRAGLVRLAAFIVGDRGTGEDVVQDVFARVHQRGHPVDGGLLPYLRAAVVNSCRNAVRRRLLIRRHAEKHAPCPPLTTEEAAMLSEDRRQVLAAFTAMPARIAEALRAEGTSIYQTGRVDRQVYEIRAVVQPGDSGGPLLSPSGTVDGMVQQVESGTPDTGFALTASYAQADAKAAASATAPVSTQGCALH